LRKIWRRWKSTFFVNGLRYERVPEVPSLVEALQLTAPVGS
jgi:hypothetical protein